MKKICAIHGPYVSYTNPLGMSELSDYETTCPGCRREANRKEEEELVATMQQHDRLRDLELRGIEPEFFGATLDNYQPETPTEEEALASAKQLVTGKLQKLMLLGDYGTGKTHLGCALVSLLQGRRITMYELSGKIRQGYNNGKNELDILDELLTYPVIFFDEVGRTKGSESEMNWLSYLIDKCHTRHIKVVMASNKHQAKTLPPEKKDQAFERWLPNDVISRLRQNSALVDIKGRDRRCGGT